MWLYRFTNELLRRRWQSILFTFAITFIPIIGMVGILIAALVTLVKGMVEGAIFTLAATLPYLVSFFISGKQESGLPLMLLAAVGVAMLSNLLTWIFAVMLRQKTGWSSLLQIVALAGVLVISVIHLAYPDVADWWGQELQNYYKHVQLFKDALQSSSASRDAQLESINVTKQYATGVMATVILFNALFQLVMARWWQNIVFNTKNLGRELRSIRLSPLAGILFITSLVLFYLGNSVVLDIMPILYTLFSVAGLSLIHYLFRSMPSPSTWFWLFLLYVALLISWPTSMVLVSTLALADIWLDIRKRIKKT
ncbi:MAG: DUF2232 domain-containing protein [Gammaproteobacteria bacterium]|nr:DUF2232 domain-containing protein [Gammaproteobacteria bacterium]